MNIIFSIFTRDNDYFLHILLFRIRNTIYKESIKLRASLSLDHVALQHTSISASSISGNFLLALRASHSL